MLTTAKRSFKNHLPSVSLSITVYGLMAEPHWNNTALFMILAAFLHYSKDHAFISEGNLPVVSFSCVLVHVAEQSQSSKPVFLLDEIKLHDVSRRKLRASQLLKGFQSHILLSRANLKELFEKPHGEKEGLCMQN